MVEKLKRAAAAIGRKRRPVAVAVMTSVFAVITVGTGQLWLRDAFLDSNTVPVREAPTLDQLNASIALGERFITALYKPLPNGEAVQSEASGVPFKAYFPDEQKWALLGEDSGLATQITDVAQDSSHDRYTVRFASPSHSDALTVRVAIDWQFSDAKYQIQIEPVAVKERVALWLDTRLIADFEPNGVGNVSLSLARSDQSALRNLRFTVRHATQEAFLYWMTYGADPERAASLAKFLSRNGYSPGVDLRAPMFNRTAMLPDDLPVNRLAYPDCQHLAASSEFAYAYHSRVCLYERLYIVVGERDPFLQAWAALTVLDKYHDPNHPLPESSLWIQGSTPASISRHLQGQWNRTGDGIPKCTPFSCGELSSIRTSVFGALEAELGYRYGDASAQRFADAAAHVVIATQVKADGTIPTARSGTYVRPGQAGSYMSAWSAGLKYTEPSAPGVTVAVARWLRGQRAMLPEYSGLTVSNSETTFDALGFLQMYRCAKYDACTLAQ